MSYYSQNQVDAISASISLLDYFNDLARRGIVQYDRKIGKEHYFRTAENKFAVTDRKYFDFKTGEGGEIIKAVMHFENKTWKEAMDYLKQNSDNYIADEAFSVQRQNTVPHHPPMVHRTAVPSNGALLGYFEKRGISKDILLENTQQVHFEAGGKRYFGIGIENQSGGYEVRNSFLKTKIGKSDLTIIKGNKKNETVVFEGLTDMLSFLQLQKNNGVKNSRTLVALNSVMNSDKFIENYKDYDGRIFLCLDGDRAGDNATEKIISSLPNGTAKDIRSFYGISATGITDLNDYLVEKAQNQKKNLNLPLQNPVYNGTAHPQSGTIPKTYPAQQQATGTKTATVDHSRQPKLNGNNGGSLDANGSHARNGSSNAVGSHRGQPSGLGASASGTQYRDAGTEIGEKDAVVGRIPGLKNHSPEQLVSEYQNRKLTNEEVAEFVSAVCIVTSGQKVELRENIPVSEELRNIVAQFKSGGTEKEGRGILDEYYTDRSIVKAVREIIGSYFSGNENLKVLEPSAGTGNFIDAAKGISASSEINVFEINETAAKIAKILHPHIEVNLRSFESEFISENGDKKDAADFEEKYDLVIGNPPYGEHRGVYRGLGEEAKISRYEDYFVKRSLDSLKPGGILAMVLPSGWLNPQKKLQSAELLQAYRLPEGAFAGTKVGTDIIILKKSSEKISKNITDYFERNPAHILGSVKEKTNRFGKKELYVSGSLSEALLILQQLQNQKKQTRIGNLFEDFFTEQPVQAKPTTLQETSTENSAEEKNAEAADVKQLMLETKEKANEALALLQLIKFKSALVNKEIHRYELLNTQLSNDPQKFSKGELQQILKKAETLVASRQDKNSEYLLQTKPEIKKGILKYHFAKGDEIVDTALQNASKFTEAQLSAFRDTKYDGELKNRAKHYEFANYYDGKWIHDFYYAEGNIYAKLAQLERDFTDKFAVGGTENQYEKQKALLQSVLPKPKSLDEIIISPNHEFVHQFPMGTVERERWNPDIRKTEIVTENASLADTFKSFLETLPSSAFAGSSPWEVKGFVDNENVTGSDKERNALIRERRKEAGNDLFQKYIREELSDVDRDRFVSDFNRKFNHIHVPDYAQFPLFSKINKNFKGSPLALTEVQTAGVGRLTTKGVGLLAHEVGFGKTLSGIVSLHEAMDRGNAKRPLIVVPNSNILKQWVETIFETVPHAKVNVLGNLGKDFDLSKFDNKDGEITIVTYEGFNNIGFSKSVTENLASRFSYISENELRAVKNSERDLQIEILKEKEIEGRMRRGKIYDWEDFGFDHITFDEVHNANHIVGKVRIEDRRFSSDFRSQNQRTSGLGINAWMACQYIQKKNNGRNVTLLSATPFTNKPLEYYSILSLIANKRLEESGYFKVNNFFETFMEADNEMEIGATGDVKFKSNVRRFKNNSLFQQLLSEFIDLKGEEDNPGLIRPNRINKEYKIEQNGLTKEQYEILNDSFDEKEPGAVLTHILNARLIAFSPYLSVNNSEDLPPAKEFVENSPKLKLTMELIAQNKKDVPHAGQIIYSELAVAEFPKLKDYLISEVGFKPQEVGIITGTTSKNQRIDIQNDFNSGKIKVIIGSEAIQEGMNLQEHTSDMYLLSLPYNFTSLRQVEGRAWRQGNQFENVRINYMLTNDSIDVFMLQKLQAKQARYLEAMKKGANIVDVSDVNTQELKTAIITSPETRANIEIELLKKKLQNEKDRYVADQSFVLRKYEDYTKVLDKVTAAQESFARIKQWAGEGGEESVWTRHISNYEANVNRAKQELKETIDYLATKGVNVKEIEEQNRLTDAKITMFEQKLAKLPDLRVSLVNRYKKENEIRLRNVSKIDYVAERKAENDAIFPTRTQNIAEKQSAAVKR